jgi:FdhD protein
LLKKPFSDSRHRRNSDKGAVMTGKDEKERAISVEQPITRIDAQGRAEVTDLLLLEEPYSLFCNGEAVSELHCSPVHLEQLAVGHLFCRKRLEHAAEIVRVLVDHDAGRLEVETRFAPPPAPETGEDVRLAASRIHSLQADFDGRCGLYRRTGASHSCALADEMGIIVFLEDIARHNALDKVIGEMVLKGISPRGKALIFSGRMAYDMLEKSDASGVKMLVAPGAPSLTSVKMAQARGITLLGFVREDNINIYSHPQRVL